MNKRLFSALPLFLYAPDGVAGTGSASETDNKPTETVTAPAKGETPAPEIPHNLTTEELRERLLTANARIRVLNDENANRRHSSKMSETDTAELAAYRATGFKPADLKTELETGRTAKVNLTERERLDELAVAAPDLGFKPSVLKRLAPKLPVISKEVDIKGDDGKFTKQKQWFFKDGDTETEIAAYFANDEEALSLLKADDSGGSGQQRVQISQAARRYVPQGGGSGNNGNDDPITQRQKQREEARKNNPNPLMVPPTVPGAKRP